MSRSFALAGLVSAAAVLLSGCAGPALPTSGPVAMHPRPDAGMDALLEGTLRTDGGCVRVEFGDDSAMPTFPVGDAEWADDTLVWRGESYSDGDPIALGGGFGGTASVPSASGYVPEPCAGLQVFVVSPY